MSTSPVSWPEDDARVAPHQLVALAVLQRALGDATSRGGDRHYRERREDARAFLSGGPALDFWIAVLGCDPRDVRAMIARSLNGHGHSAMREKPNKTGPKRGKIGVGPGAINAGTDP